MPADPNHPPAHADTVVVGAGIGGLLAAITAAGAAPHRRVVVLDPHPAGGRARCDRRDGFTLNRGPRALYIGGPAERALRAVGVDTSNGGKPHVAGGVALHAGALHRFPGTPMDSMRTGLLSTTEKASVSRTVAALWRHRASDGSQTVEEWLDGRKLSPTVRQFVEALVRVATYANAPEVFAAGPALANAKLGISPGVRYLDGGWQSLVDQLLVVARDRGVDLISMGARSVVSHDDAVTVTTTGGHEIDATAAVLAVGAPDAAAALLGGAPASWPELGPPSTAACLELGIRGVPSRRFALGIDEPLYASTHCPPADLAPDGHAVVHLMRYQPVTDAMSASDQHARLRSFASEIGIRDGQVVTERFLARMVVTGALPIAAAGGLAGRAPVAVADHPGVLLSGDWVGPTGMLLDAVASSGVEAGRLAAARSTTMVPA